MNGTNNQVDTITFNEPSKRKGQDKMCLSTARIGLRCLFEGVSDGNFICSEYQEYVFPWLIHEI